MKENRKQINLWIEQHEQSERLKQILNCFGYRGIATGDQIEYMTGLGQHPVRDALKTLSELPGGLDPLLRSINVTLPGQRGRPYAAFILTEAGTASLNDETRKAPKLDEPVEAAHALMEMQVFIAAHQHGKRTELERVIPYEGLHNIRADALLESKTIFEMEQQARLNDVPRISDKLERLVRFFNSPAGHAIDPKVRILFALSASDGKTIKIWQQVLAAVEKKNGSLPFELHWQDINLFLEKPNWENTSGLNRLKPAEIAQVNTPQNKDDATKQVILVPEFIKHNFVDLLELQLIMNVMESDIGQLDEAWKQNRYQFFQMMEVIYDGSHYPGGPVESEATYPAISMMLLYRFLHLHQNKPLFERMQNGYRKVQYSQRQALPYFRDQLTRFYWDVFLRYFNFGRGGPLKVKVEVPNFGDSRSEIYPIVSITDWDLLRSEDGYAPTGEPAHAEAALTWVLEAMHLYAYDLGLVGGKFSARKKESKEEKWSQK